MFFSTIAAEISWPLDCLYVEINGQMWGTVFIGKSIRYLTVVDTLEFGCVGWGHVCSCYLL